MNIIANNINNIDSHIGYRLKLRRRQLKLSQNDLAKQLGISYQQIQKYEQGMTRVSAGLLYEISNLFYVSINYFYEGYENNQLKNKGIINLHRREELDILLIEDNLDDEAVIRKSLLNCGTDINIQSMHNHLDVLTFLRNNNSKNPDIIILDIHIAKQSGFKLLQNIKADRNLRHIPILILTHSMSYEEMHKTYVMHANGFISKALNDERFNENMQRMITYWREVVVLPS